MSFILRAIMLRNSAKSIVPFPIRKCNHLSRKSIYAQNRLDLSKAVFLKTMCYQQPKSNFDSNISLRSIFSFDWIATRLKVKNNCSRNLLSTKNWQHGFWPCICSEVKLEFWVFFKQAICQSFLFNLAWMYIKLNINLSNNICAVVFFVTAAATKL